MKKISVLLLFISINLFLAGATITGNIKVEKGQDLGVFVYVEDLFKYDISDERGNFTIDDLQLNKEYTLVFQKGDLPDHKEKIMLTSENQKMNFTLPYVRRDVKYEVSGRVNSKLDNDIFIALNNESYGIIVKPNLVFNTKLADGGYNATILQEGSYNKNINFEVLKKDANNIGTYNLEAIDYNTLTLRFGEKVKEGVLQLYKNDKLEHSERIKSGSSIITISALKEGMYDLIIKSYGKREYRKRVEVVGNVVKDIELENLSKYDNLFVNIYPADVEATVKIFDDGDLISEKKGKGLVILDSLDYTKYYDIAVTSPKYKGMVTKRLTAGDNVDINLVRDIKGTLVKGFIYPFNSGAQVMLLENNKILATSSTDSNGYYELETDDITSGRKIIRVRAKGFEEKIINRTFNQEEVVVDENIELEPVLNKLNGKVVFNNQDELRNVLVIIEELSIWQFTNENGEYYFKNIPEGTYNIIFKKLGYETKYEKMKVKKESAKLNLTNMNPVGKIIFRSNLPGYRLTVNGENYNINQKVYEKVSTMGVVNISAFKEGYLPVNTRIKLTEAGEIRDIFFNFVDREKQNKLVEEKISVIEEHIKNLQIAEAESELYELAEMPTLKVYESEYLDIKSKLKDAKSILFDIDRNIKFEIEKVNHNISTMEDEKIGYLEKQRNLQKVYKQSIDYLEKIVLYHPYTTFRYDIHKLQGDIYVKMGMINSSKNAYEEADKYIDRRKEY